MHGVVKRVGEGSREREDENRTHTSEFSDISINEQKVMERNGEFVLRVVHTTRVRGAIFITAKRLSLEGSVSRAVTARGTRPRRTRISLAMARRMRAAL
ncbi:hypothetical protein C0Q70_01742 [Pomacea canaliculata]|uniref:Uncharacterized protein n=1 Tax=Pomacea canaliculata TaxID=400727 RepID=A0A2T7Q0B2_POMCA|nr:hypothetical protein C0Q70_01742 [Pomacea canaliculata]